MKPSRARLRIEALEDRTNPAPVNIGFGNGVHQFDVAGYKLLQNNNNMPTTSSAFGFKEASMIAPQQVDTVNGGLVMSTLNDAFDGVLSFGLATGGVTSTTTYFDADGVVDITGNTITGDPNTHGTNGNTFNGLALSQQNAIFALHAGVPVIRSLLTITNPTAAPITQLLGDFNNPGSDSNTTIFTTSSCDATFSAAADRWVVTFQAFVGTRSNDPRILQVMQGPGTVQSPFSTNWTGNGNDKPNWNYSVTVGPGQTKYIMEFVALYPTRAQAASDGHAVFDSSTTVASNGLLAGLTAQQMANVVNWDLPPAVSAFSAPNVTNASSRAQYDFTVTFTDNTAVNIASLLSHHLLVTGPHGYSQLASFFFANPNGDGTPRTATYRLTAGQLPGGNGWDAFDNGTYTLTLQANQVADTIGNFAAAGVIGTFTVNAPASIAAPSQGAVQEAGKTVQLLQGVGASLAAVALGEVSGDFTSDIVVAFRLRNKTLLIASFSGVNGKIVGVFQPFRNPVGASARVRLVTVNLNADPALEIGLIVTPDGLGVPHISAFTVAGIRLF